MSNIILSIVVPTYNVEKYLDKCLDAFVRQNLKDTEIILVNDGSTDNSQKIIDKFVEKYPKLFKSFIKENGGLADARNYGVEKAKGKYITFIDPDDYVDDEYFNTLLKDAIDNDLDLVIADMRYVWENNEKEPMVQNGLNNVNDNINKSLFISSLSVCNKLFKKELFDTLTVKFPKGLWYEDIPVCLAYVAKCKKIKYNDGPKYNYLQRETSILGSKYSPKMHDIFTVFDGVLKYFKDNNLYNEYKDELEYLLVEHFLVYGAFRFLRTDHYKELMPKAFDYVKKEFPNCKNNKYIKTFGKKNQIFLKTNNKYTMGLWHLYLTK